MFITIDILQKRGACQEYLDFFNKRFPNGVEMMEMIERGHLPYHALHWGYQWLDPSPEEVAAYWKAVHVEKSQGVHESDHVSNSEIVVGSSHISGSSNIYNSEQIETSTNITDSKFITDSSHISDSEFVDASTRVLRGKNVTDSSEIVDSVYIVNSHGIFDSNNIIDGHTIWYSNNLTNCGFCSNCKGLSNALFCFKQEDGEYLVFNKPVDKTRFDIINRQFRRYASVVADMISGFDGAPTKIMDYRKHTENIPNAFWSWVKTLPGYDPMIIYSLTFNPLFLK